MNFSILLLILSNVYSQSLDSTLNNLEISAHSIPDVPCSSQILMTLNEAEAIYASQGLSKDFLSALEDVKTVSGDLPLASQFRSLLDKSIQSYQDSNNTISLNTTVFKTGPGLPEGFGKKSSSISAYNYVMNYLFVLFIIIVLISV